MIHSPLIRFAVFLAALCCGHAIYDGSWPTLDPPQLPALASIVSASPEPSPARWTAPPLAPSMTLRAVCIYSPAGTRRLLIADRADWRHRDARIVLVPAPVTRASGLDSTWVGHSIHVRGLLSSYRGRPCVLADSVTLDP